MLSLSWALVLPLLLLLLYLPFYVTLTEQRYFYPAYPFLFSALAIWATASNETKAESVLLSQEWGGWWLAVLGALFPLLLAIIMIGAAPKMAGDSAAELARRFERAHLAGPIAGSGMLPGGRTGLYLAFLLNQPWYGDKPNPTAGDFKASGAEFVIVRRDSALADELDRDPGFIALNQRLFSTKPEAESFPLKVYAIEHSL